ncbi:hypothetical protein HY605_01500 [Candidatus Peregrinibacteria bacterium]|nr:hypothetical protein [Candidatus Peregrinibacteria bacterium]
MFKLTIRTPYEEAYSAEVNSVYLSTEGGDMQAYENHASVTATVLFSPVVIEEDGKEEHFMVRNGIFLFDNDKNEALILAGSCEKTSQISYQTVEEYAKFIDQQLAEGKDLSEFQILYLKNEKVAVEAQMEVVKPAKSN